MARPTTIKPGQRFREVVANTDKSFGTEWIVKDVSAEADGVEYARLINSTDPAVHRTITARVLEDERRFTLV